MNQYTDLKPAWHLDKIGEMREGKQIVPAQMQLIISDLCNHDCPWCAYRLSGYTSNANFGEVRADGTVNNNPNRMIPYEKCIEILDDAWELGIKAVQFTGGGEPTAHPRHVDIFAYALGKGFKCALVTNGNILRPGWEKVLPFFEWIRVSVDAGTAETYAAIRRVKESAFEKCLSNIGALDLARRPHQVLGTSFVVMRENYPECRTAAMLVRLRGADSIRYAAVFTPEDEGYYREGLYEECQNAVQEAKEEEREDFKVIDMLGQRLADLHQHAPDYSFCGYQQFNVYVGGDLNVYRCCDTAYNDRGLTGSLKGQRLLDFWRSAEKEEAYRNFDARGCERCAFNGKNRLINYLVRPQSHVEFV